MSPTCVYTPASVTTELAKRFCARTMALTELLWMPETLLEGPRHSSKWLPVFTTTTTPLPWTAMDRLLLAARRSRRSERRWKILRSNRERERFRKQTSLSLARMAILAMHDSITKARQLAADYEIKGLEATNPAHKTVCTREMHHQVGIAVKAERKFDRMDGAMHESFDGQNGPVALEDRATTAGG